MSGDRSALIVGAGIGGLAAAISLQRAGWRVRVLERANNPRELGFALALAPNALKALRELGLAEHTVKAHVTAVLRALKVSSRTEAALAAARLGLGRETGPD